jgi:hypothetical protein
MGPGVFYPTKVAAVIELLEPCASRGTQAFLRKAQ